MASSAELAEASAVQILLSYLSRISGALSSQWRLQPAARRVAIVGDAPNALILVRDALSVYSASGGALQMRVVAAGLTLGPLLIAVCFACPGVDVLVEHVLGIRCSVSARPCGGAVQVIARARIRAAGPWPTDATAVALLACSAAAEAASRVAGRTGRTALLNAWFLSHGVLPRIRQP